MAIVTLRVAASSGCSVLNCRPLNSTFREQSSAGGATAGVSDSATTYSNSLQTGNQDVIRFFGRFEPQCQHNLLAFR